MTSGPLYQIINKKLIREFKDVKPISHWNSIWFIDVKSNNWYFEYLKNGVVWWNEELFTDFFMFFSIDSPDFHPYIKDWFEKFSDLKVNLYLANPSTMKNYVDDILMSHNI